MSLINRRTYLYGDDGDDGGDGDDDRIEDLSYVAFQVIDCESPSLVLYHVDEMLDRYRQDLTADPHENHFQLLPMLFYSL